MNIATLNVHYLTKPKLIAQLIIDNDIHVCGLQEVGGDKSLQNLLKLLPNYQGLFDKTYYSFGNGIVYSTNVFKLIDSQQVNLGYHSGTKRSAFIITLLHKESNINYKFCVTHLDHINEENRLIEWNNAIKHNIDDCIVLSDMNALTAIDYSPDKLLEISKTRLAGKWEPPKFTLMEIVAKTHHDINVGGLPTSRFNTRIDYILVPHSLISTHTINKTNTITCDATDHSMVCVQISNNFI